MTTPVVIHGHFDQPPRENPWTEYIDGEPGAAPYSDWNARWSRSRKILRGVTGASRYWSSLSLSLSWLPF